MDNFRVIIDTDETFATLTEFFSDKPTEDEVIPAYQAGIAKGFRCCQILNDGATAMVGDGILYPLRSGPNKPKFFGLVFSNKGYEIRTPVGGTKEDFIQSVKSV